MNTTRSSTRVSTRDRALFARHGDGGTPSDLALCLSPGFLHRRKKRMARRCCRNDAVQCITTGLNGQPPCSPLGRPSDGQAFHHLEGVIDAARDAAWKGDPHWRAERCRHCCVPSDFQRLAGAIGDILVPGQLCRGDPYWHVSSNQRCGRVAKTHSVLHCGFPLMSGHSTCVSIGEAG